MCNFSRIYVVWKVKNIVLPNVSTFQSIYRPLLHSKPPITELSSLATDDLSLLSSISLPILDVSSSQTPRHSHDSNVEFTFTNFLHAFPIHFTTLLHHEDAKKLYLHYLSLRNGKTGSPTSPLSLKDRERIVDKALRKIVAW